GAFKQAVMGESTAPLFRDTSNYEICAKQTIYTSQQQLFTGETVRQNIPHDSAQQAKMLEMEMRCLAFTDGLLTSVYRWINSAVVTLGPPPFEIPRMRFVQAGLAMSEVGERVLLVEEAIRPAQQGKFRKFMNNRNTIPTAFTDLGDRHRARFLAFSQHVQYWLTFKLAFVSDYQ
ncbi:hypothetical protein C8J57DRAFT_1021958, partial [Mycena rebaudengoi]